MISTFIIIAIIWILISQYNFMLLPEDLKETTNLISFIIFIIISPIVTIISILNLIFNKNN